MADGGPGFVAALAEGLGGDIRSEVVRGPKRERFEVFADYLLVSQGGVLTAYVESSQACGKHLMDRPEPNRASTFGVGELIVRAVQGGARRVIVGLGGSATTDGGAGALLAMGARAHAKDGSDTSATLGRGGAELTQIATLDLSGVRRVLGDIELQVATDVDSPLLGPTGAAQGFGPQKGASPEQVVTLEAALAHFRRTCEAAGADAGAATAPGAGAAGGLGYGLMAAGAARVSGVGCVLSALDLGGRLGASDLVLTGEGKFDWQSLHGKVISGIADEAAARGTPVVVIAGQVDVAEAEWRRTGIVAVYSVAEVAGSVSRAMAQAGAFVADTAALAAATWTTA